MTHSQESRVLSPLRDSQSRGEGDANEQLAPEVDGNGPGGPDQAEGKDHRGGDRDTQDRTSSPNDQAPFGTLSRVKDLLNDHADRPQSVPRRDVRHQTSGLSILLGQQQRHDADLQERYHDEG